MARKVFREDYLYLWDGLSIMYACILWLHIVFTFHKILTVNCITFIFRMFCCEAIFVTTAPALKLPALSIWSHRLARWEKLTAIHMVIFWLLAWVANQLCMEIYWYHTAGFEELCGLLGRGQCDWAEGMKYGTCIDFAFAKGVSLIGALMKSVMEHCKCS